ncbi:MAG TPA: hypothetical protein VKB57_18305 [Acidimicrobiales bacterium]|nr:hypothetical protein [Acidimicrobiales bacterium]
MDAAAERTERDQPWEIRVQVEIDTLRVMAASATQDCGGHPPCGVATCPVCSGWQAHLLEAERYLDSPRNPLRWWAGTRVEGAWGHVDAAAVEMVRGVFDTDQIVGLTPRIQGTIDRCLRPLRPERVAANALLDRLGREHTVKLTRHDRECLASALTAANDSNAANYQRLRRFQGKVMGSALVMILLVLFILYVGVAHPRLVPLCFPDPQEQVDEAPTPGAPAAEPAPVVCPGTATPAAGDPLASQDADQRASSTDVATVLLFGLIGAALTSVAFVIRPASATPLPATSIRVFQGLLKAATGMITAILGLLFLRAGVVPGFTRIDTRSQILVYAVVFGAAQQLVTRLIDARSDSLLDSVKTNASPVVSGDETGPDDAAS